MSAQTRTLRLEPMEQAARQRFDSHVKVALLVGINTYPQGSGLGSLKYASRDADVLEATLKSQGYLVRKLIDSNATRPVIRRTLRELSDLMSKDEGTLLFYFGGHGFTYKGINYLATFGVTADDLDGEGLAVKDVEALLLSSKAKRKVMLLDACRNDPGQPSRSANQRTFESLRVSEGIRVLFSTKAGRVSYEDDTLKEGIFTYYVAKGLSGDAAGSDGLVTFHDLADYVTDRMRAFTVTKGEVQIPFEAGEASGDFILSMGSRNTAAQSETAGQTQSRLNPDVDAVAKRLSFEQGVQSGGRTLFESNVSRQIRYCVMENRRETFAKGRAAAHLDGDTRTVVQIPFRAINPKKITLHSPARPSMEIPFSTLELHSSDSTKIFTGEVSQFKKGVWYEQRAIHSEALPDLRWAGSEEVLAELLKRAVASCQQ